MSKKRKYLSKSEKSVINYKVDVYYFFIHDNEDLLRYERLTGERLEVHEFYTEKELKEWIKTINSHDRKISTLDNRDFKIYCVIGEKAYLIFMRAHTAYCDGSISEDFFVECPNIAKYFDD